MIKKIELDFHGRPLSIEVGRMAKQADGAALVRYGETVVLVTAVAAKDLKLDTDFFPLTVDYQEKTFAAASVIRRRAALRNPSDRHGAFRRPRERP
ncbi:MAG: hypothetical protein E6J73_10495 [Deltaproteobacteria bacterium]|nr:MAG: hypothetical protein E6J73_10495 [Deltaproteobacteria bacterium]